MNANMSFYFKCRKFLKDADKLFDAPTIFQYPQFTNRVYAENRWQLILFLYRISYFPP